MGVDGYLGEVAVPDLPVVRLYTWDRPTISYGCNQNAARRIDLEQCARQGVPVVKRPTGGRELLHGHDICYTVLIPLETRISAVEAKKIFGWINAVLADALHGAGIEVRWKNLEVRQRTAEGPCFAQIDLGELSIEGRKLAASAQRVFDRCLVQQGSIPLRPAPIDLVDYLLCGDKDNLKSKMREVTTYLDVHLKETIDDTRLVSLFRQAFERAFGSSALPANDIFSILSWNTIETYLYH